MYRCRQGFQGHSVASRGGSPVPGWPSRHPYLHVTPPASRPCTHMERPSCSYIYKPHLQANIIAKQLFPPGTVMGSYCRTALVFDCVLHRPASGRQIMGPEASMSLKCCTIALLTKTVPVPKTTPARIRLCQAALTSHESCASCAPTAHAGLVRQTVVGLSTLTAMASG